MITGVVNVDLEATIQLEVLGTSGLLQLVSVVLDTGFSGSLTLPSAIIAALGLAWLGRGQGVLADGSVGLFDVFEATVRWMVSSASWRLKRSMLNHCSG